MHSAITTLKMFIVNLDFAQVNAQTDLYFLIRYCSEVAAIDSEHFRVVFHGQLYNISFVDNVQYKNKTLKLRASLVKR